MGHLGLNPYVYRDAELVLVLTKANTFLKATALSASALICCDQLLSAILMHVTSRY